MTTAWLALGGAIALEIMSTLSLRSLAAGWQPLATVGVVVGYVGAFSCLALALRGLNVGAAYAIWSGVGTAGITLLAAVLYDERITLVAAGGIGLIVAGVVLLTIGGATHG
ncbi:multidrug efflux SMR transporter [Frankia sp. QA3]|uniref:DMT family transporter n=1 Tax=Frankia sp. QA3 TaxID=710111 RepID=UPI000269BBE4|nr:SMR family transporter [Frankia sp. QA3]EIV92181.1 cation/cationic drug transporter [Frankia sp. QA3]